MRRLFGAAGIDFLQWRALMRAHIWMDYGSLFGVNGSAEAWRALTQFVVMFGVLSTAGLFLAAVVWGARDLFFAAVIVVTSMMFWAGLMVLTQPASLAAPVDYEIVAPRPVTSRTYFAVRVAALLLIILETTVFMGWLPVLAFLTRKDGGLPVALASAAAMLAGAVATTAGVIAMYGWLIRLIPPARLTRILAYAGGAVSLVLTTAFTLSLYAMVENDRPLMFLRTSLSHDLRTYWFPAAWFASYVTLAQGAAVRADLIAAATSGLVLALFGWALGGRMSLDYAARVADLTALTSRQRPPLFERAWFFRSGEARAVGILIASHLRGDPRFQLAVASSCTMGIVIVVGSSGFQMPVDPFVVSGSQRVGGLTMPLFALIMVPMQVYQTIATTTAPEASWLYFATPADRSRLITAARDAIALYVLGPLVLLLAGFYVYAFRHVGHAFVHSLFLALLAYLSLQLIVAIAPRLPLSVPVIDRQHAAFPIATTFLLMFVMMPLSLAVQHFAYRSRLAMIVALSVLVAISIALDALTRHRLARSRPAL